MASGTVSVFLLLIASQAAPAQSRVVAWGATPATNVPFLATNAVQIAVGDYQAGAIRADGRPVFWGSCWPTNALGQSNVAALALGYCDEYIALATNGNLYSSSGVYASNIAAICHWGPILALKDDGTVIDFPQLTNVVAIASGYYNGLALKSDGTCVAWNYHNSSTDNMPPPDLSNVVSIAAGPSANLALKSDGTVVAWGLNTTIVASMPSGLRDVIAIAAGGNHGLALKSDGTVVGWGTDPPPPPGLSNVVAIASKFTDSLAIVGPAPPRINLNQFGRTNNTFQVAVPTASGRTYALEYATTLPATNWTALPLVAGNGRIRVLTDPNANDQQRFYRVRQW